MRAFRWLRAAVGDAYHAQSYPLGYSPALDGLRGALTIGVLVAHIRAALAPGAPLLMDIFFVMSGYFITGLLLRDWDRYGRIRFRAFYLRRFARLVPPLAAMLLTYLAFGLFVLPNVRSTATDAALAFGYVMNLSRAGLLPIAPPEVSYLGHTWSLAIEEQFYLTWPFLLALLLRACGTRWHLFAAIVALAAALAAWRIFLTQSGAPWYRLYNGADTRADALLIGGALSVWLRITPLEAHPRIARAFSTLAWPLLVFVVAMVAWIGVAEEGRSYYLAGSLFAGALPGVLLVVILVRPGDTVLHRIFEQPLLCFIGRIFYAAYLWHLPIFAVLDWHYGLRAGWRALIGFPAVFGIALLSYALIERHFIRRGPTPP